jgi:hypothetical protein
MIKILLIKQQFYQKQKNYIDELITTEKHYIEILSNTIDFLESKTKYIFTSKEHSTLFSQQPQILQAQSLFYCDLREETRDMLQFLQMVLSIFSHVFKTSQLYISNFQIFLKSLKILPKKLIQS